MRTARASRRRPSSTATRRSTPSRRRASTASPTRRPATRSTFRARATWSSACSTFAQARAKAQSVDGMFGFLDGAALTRLVDSTPANADNKSVEAFKQFFHGVGASSVESVAFTSTFEDGRVAERAFIVAPNREGVLATVAANQPTQGALLALVPSDAVAAFDASIANAPQTFEQVLALATQLSEQSGKKSPADALAEFTEKTGVDFRGEILNSLGTEFCAAQLTAGDSPSGVVIINLKDEQAFTQALAKIAASKHHATTERDYKGTTIHRVEGENNHALEYAIVGGNFVASGKSEERRVGKEC